MIESAAAQWKPRNGPEAAADFFSSQPNKPLDPLNKQPPEATAGRRQTKNEHKRALCPLIFPKSKTQQAIRRLHHISLEHLSSPNRPIENKEK